jgi:hypothetical protein
MLDAMLAAAPAPVAQGDEAKWTKADLWAEIHRLRSEAAGPDGFATWKDAAVAERVRRVRAEAIVPVAQPADPMDWPLPCDVKVGHVTIGKGCTLRLLAARTQVLYDMVQAAATPAPVLTPAQQHAEELRAALIRAEEKLVKCEDALAGGDDEIYIESEILSARAVLAKIEATGQEGTGNG